MAPHYNWFIYTDSKWPRLLIMTKAPWRPHTLQVLMILPQKRASTNSSTYALRKSTISAPSTLLASKLTLKAIASSWKASNSFYQKCRCLRLSCALVQSINGYSISKREYRHRKKSHISQAFESSWPQIMMDFLTKGFFACMATLAIWVLKTLVRSILSCPGKGYRYLGSVEIDK